MGSLGGRREGVVALANELGRAAVVDEGSEEPDDEDERGGAREGETRLARRRHAPFGEPEAGPREPGCDRQQQDVDGEAMPLVRRRRDRCIEPRERLLVVGEEHGEPGRDCEHEPGEQELQAARVDRDGHGEPDCSGDPGSPAEREVERGEEDRLRRRGHGACGDGLRPGREAEREEGAHRGEEAGRVPVGQRLFEPVRGDGVEGSEALGKEPRQEAVAGREEDRGECRRQQERHSFAAQHEQNRGEDGDVHEHAQPFEDGRRRVLAPHDREPRPGAEPGQPSERDEREPARPCRHAEPEDGGDEDERDQRGPRPRGREIAAAREGDECEPESRADARPDAPGVPVETRRRRGQLSHSAPRSEGRRVSGREVARQSWQFGQNQVPRPPARVFSIGWPQRVQASPARP